MFVDMVDWKTATTEKWSRLPTEMLYVFTVQLYQESVGQSSDENINKSSLLVFSLVNVHKENGTIDWIFA